MRTIYGSIEAGIKKVGPLADGRIGCCCTSECPLDTDIVQVVISGSSLCPGNAVDPNGTYTLAYDPALSFPTTHVFSTRIGDDLVYFSCVTGPSPCDSGVVFRDIGYIKNFYSETEASETIYRASICDDASGTIPNNSTVCGDQPFALSASTGGSATWEANP